MVHADSKMAAVVDMSNVVDFDKVLSDAGR